MFYIKALQCHSHINSSRIKDTNCSNYTGITLVYYLETQISVNPPTLYHRFSISNTNSMSGEWSVKLFDCFGDSGTCMQSCFSVVLAPLIHGFPILHVWFHFFCNYTGCLTCWCPCITFGRIAEIVDKGSTCRHINLSLRALVQAQKTINLVCWLSLFPACCMHGTLYVLLATIGCQWLYACTKRSSMRAQYNLQQSPCLDCCVHFFCDSCALCQEYKELEKRGFNMSKGLLAPSQFLLKEHKNREEKRSGCSQRQMFMTNHDLDHYIFTGWEGSNKMVGCVQGMKPPRKQRMWF